MEKNIKVERRSPNRSQSEYRLPDGDLQGDVPPTRWELSQFAYLNSLVNGQAATVQDQAATLEEQGREIQDLRMALDLARIYEMEKEGTPGG